MPDSFRFQFPVIRNGFCNRADIMWCKVYSFSILDQPLTVDRVDRGRVPVRQVTVGPPHLSILSCFRRRFHGVCGRTFLSTLVNPFQNSKNGQECTCDYIIQEQSQLIILHQEEPTPKWYSVIGVATPE